MYTSTPNLKFLSQVVQKLLTKECFSVKFCKQFGFHGNQSTKLKKSNSIAWYPIPIYTSMPNLKFLSQIVQKLLAKTWKQAKLTTVWFPWQPKIWQFFKFCFYRKCLTKIHLHAKFCEDWSNSFGVMAKKVIVSTLTTTTTTTTTRPQAPTEY